MDFVETCVETDLFPAKINRGERILLGVKTGQQLSMKAPGRSLKGTDGLGSRTVGVGLEVGGQQLF